MLKILGDVHAGKKFINDVPLHRRGEREGEVLSGLSANLRGVKGISSHVQVGDLFDAFEVDNNILMEVFLYYKNAAEANPSCTYYLIPGNHDLSRDSSKVSSFEIFAYLVGSIKNIVVITEPVIINKMGFLPWSPWHTAKEQAEQLQRPCDVVFCHYDIESYGGSMDNIVPVETLALITKRVVTGHIHKPQVHTFGELVVEVVGSMQPYAHGEEEFPRRYLTLSLEAIQQIRPELLRDKYIRLQLFKGQEMPEVPDCMGFKVIKGAEEETESISVAFEDFNTRNLFIACLDELKVPADTQAKVLEKFDECQ